MDIINKRYAHVSRIEIKPMSKKKKGWLNMAVKMAESSNVGKKHGAVIVRSGSLLAVGHNKWRNQAEVFDDRAKTASVHAELDALSRVKNPAGATVYIASINKRGETKLSAPCDNCFKVLMDAGIKEIIYTNNP